MTSKVKNKGFTLVEMLIVIILTLILISIATTLLTQQFRLFNTGQELLNADWRGRVALDRMVRDIRNTQNVTAAQINLISFEDEEGYIITYKIGGLNNTQLIYSSTNINAPTAILADKIKILELHYYGANGLELSTPISSANLGKIRYIAITLNITDRNTDFNLFTAVFLWNIKK